MDPSNNTSGAGQFYVPTAQLDVSCRPTTVFSDTRLSTGVLTASTPRLDIIVQGIGVFTSSNVVLRGGLGGDQQTLSGQMGGAALACTLAKIDSPDGNSTLLDVIVNFGLQPDIDLNHDGKLDRVNSDGNTVSSCTTGSGEVITGHGCTCDPRLHDGFSLGLFYDWVPATILGLVGTQ
jgi:hypothetical protein